MTKFYTTKIFCSLNVNINNFLDRNVEHKKVFLQHFNIPNDEVYLIKRIYSENKNSKGLRHLVVQVKR